jgi:Gamma interferon inducible lysosomal thiol reductase (GILT)
MALSRPLRTFVPVFLLGMLAMSYYWRSTAFTQIEILAPKAIEIVQQPLEPLVAPEIAPATTPLVAQPKVSSKTPVDLEIHIMSKCPDAKLCLNALIVPTMAEVSPLVNFNISFIGEPTYVDDGVRCMHGPMECLGNILILCAAQAYPDPKQYLGFSNCLISKFTLIPQRALVQSCALEYGMTLDRLNECASDSTNGMQLLQDSVQRSKDLGVTKSCTVRLNEKLWCIADGGKWVDCDEGHEPADLIQAIQKLSDK